MRKVTNLVSMTAPGGLTECAWVQSDLDLHGLLYEPVWITDQSMEAMLDDRARGRKIRAVRCRCSFCGKETIVRYAGKGIASAHYGFIDPHSGTPVHDDEDLNSPCCGVAVKAVRSARLNQYGYFVASYTYAMSADIVGEEHLLALTCWHIERRIRRDLTETCVARPAEAYVFSANGCAKLLGTVTAYSGTAGYFTAYRTHWGQHDRKWSDTWGSANHIYGLTPELIAGSCLPNCKLDVYMDQFGTMVKKYPVAYLRAYQYRPAIENLVVNGLPLVLDDLLSEELVPAKWEKNHMGLPLLSEIDWEEKRPAQMLSLNKNELKLGQKLGWGAYFWRLYLGAKAHDERLTEDDFRNAYMLGAGDLLLLLGNGPVGKSIRYLLDQCDENLIDCGFMIGDEDDYGLDLNEMDSRIPDASTLIDYWDMCGKLGRDLSNPQVRWPRNLFAAHDAASDQMDRVRKGSLAKQFRVRRRLLAKYIFEYDGLLIVPADSQKALDDEGKALHHCISTYGEKYASGKSAIFFIRKSSNPKAPYYTLEFDEQHLKVLQNRGKYNHARTTDVKEFEAVWLSWVRFGAKRDKDGQPVLPEKVPEVRTA